VDRIDELRLFLAVAEHGGFSAGARAVGRSPASATRAVEGLERRLGVVLMTRTTRAVHLTGPGRAYCDRARVILEDLAQADATASGAGTVPAGRLRLTGPVRFGVLHLVPILASFLDAFPQIETDLVFVDRVVNLIDEGFDAALRIGSLPDSGLVARRVGAVRRVVCAAPAYLERHGVPEDPADLPGHRIVAAGQETPTAEWRFGNAAIRVRPRLSVNAMEAAIEAARLGQGITRVLSYQVADAVVSGDLRIVLADHEPAPLPVHLIHAEGRAASAKLRAFLDHATDGLRERLRN